MVQSERVLLDTKKLPVEKFQVVNDTILALRVISKHIGNNKLKIDFKFPQFSIVKEFEATESKDYSLRNIPDESDQKIVVGNKFYLFAYILPYVKEGVKYWCAVATSGENIENWGKNFGIKHYIVFELVFS